MADNIAITAGSGTTVAADEVSDGTLGSVKVAYGKIMDGTLNGTDKLEVTSGNAASTNIKQVGGNSVTAGAGNVAAGTPRVTLAADDPAVVSLAALDNSVDGNYLNTNMNIAGTDVVSGSGTATGALRVELPTNGTGVVGLNAGTNAIGKLAANSGVDIGDVDVTSISAGTNLVGDVGIQPRTTNGLDTMNATSSDGATALTNGAQAIKASAGKVYGYYIYNPNSSAVFVQFYNTASGSVSVGTTSPLFMLTIPAASAANLMSEIGITFGTAISWAATSTAGGNGAPTTALDAVAWYK